MRVLVIGANGLLGSNVAATAVERGWSVEGTHHSSPPDLPVASSELDLRDPGRVEAAVGRADPAAVVNCAAVTDVDGCEADPGRARAVNAAAPGVVADACGDRPLLHVSTDYVFDGRAAGRYAETAATGPVQVYGETKLAGERRVRERHDDPLVVRPSFVYGVHRGRDELVGFPAWVRERLREGASVPLFADQHVTPSRAGSLASAMLDLLAAGAAGTYHVASRSCVSPREFGDAIRERMGADPARLEAGSLDDVDRPATRPPNTCLDVSKVESRLGRPQPTLAEDLDALDDRLDAPGGSG